METAVVLLGAGASIEAGLPASGQLTPKISEWLASHIHATCGADADRSRLAAFHALTGMLIAHDSSTGRSPFNPVDIEKLFAALQFLQRRDELEIAPFVSGWRDSQYVGFDSNVYHSLSHDIQLALRDILKPRSPNHFHYLGEIFRMGIKRFATLNLDRGMEIAAELNAVPLSTGFDHWAGGLGWQWDEGAEHRLLKLHGSIDRILVTGAELGGDGSREPPGYPPLPEWDDEGLFTPGIVFGSHGKFRPDGPFLAMWLELGRWLNETEHLIICGYSFRDEHINHLITEWSSARSGRKLTVIDPGLPLPPPDFRHGSEAMLSEMAHLLTPMPSPWHHALVEYSEGEAEGCPAFPTRWIDSQPRVTLIRKGAREGLRDVAETLGRATTR